jgi:hypothetical protein
MEKYVYDVQTGKGEVVPMSDEEIQQQLELEKLSKANAAAAAQAATDKAALLAKLGITADEAKLLLS